MAEFVLPELKISVDPNNSDIKGLLKIIKPSWNTEQLKIKAISGGYSSKIFQCFDESNPEDAVTVRIRHLLDVLPLKEKHENPNELLVIQYLSKNGHFPKVHAIFANGYCYQYIKGKPMINTREKTGEVDDQMLRAIAEEMVYVHSVKLEGVEYSEESISQFRQFFFANIDADKPTKYGMNKKVLTNESALLRKFFTEKKPEIVLCHGDPHPGNYVWNKEEEKITFVDWEGARVGYQLAELAHFLKTLKRMEQFFTTSNSEPIIEKGFETKFLKYYIKAWRKIKNDDREVTEHDVAEWMEEIQIFSLEPLFMFITLGYLYPQLFLEFSQDEDLVETTVQEYLRVKEKVFGKKTFESE